MEHRQQAERAGSTGRPGRPLVDPPGRTPSTDTALAAVRAAVSRAIQVLLTGGAVLAVGELLRHLGPGPALATLVTLATASHVVVAVWMAMTGPLRPAEVGRAGAVVTCVLVLGTMALTSWVPFAQILAVLMALALLRLRLDRPHPDRA